MIKPSHISAIFLCMLFAACAGAVRQPVTEVDSGRWTGWASFSGEFLLFSSHEAMLRRDMTRCISGALPFNEQTSASEKYEGKRVSVTGVKVAWTLRRDDLAIIHQGSPIENRCSGKKIIFAETMAAME